MKTIIVLGSVMLALIPMFSPAAPMKTVHPTTAKKTTETLYECQKCHMEYNAATAKKTAIKTQWTVGSCCGSRH